MHDPLRCDDLQEKLATQWLGRELLLVGEIDSTNTLAAQRASAGAGHGLVVVAESQTAGRGRMQRQWHSPAGCNLYCSIVLRPAWDLRASPPLALAAGVAIAEAVESLISRRPELKWPNDVLLGGRKVAGVLVEAAAQSGQFKHVILGLGLNVNQSEFPAEIAARATSLRLAADKLFDRATVLAKLLGHLERWIDALGNGVSEAMLDRWRSFAPWLGGEVRVTQGDMSVAGTALAIVADGSLLIRDADGREKLLHCGDASGVMGWTY